MRSSANRSKDGALRYTPNIYIYIYIYYTNYLIVNICE